MSFLTFLSLWFKYGQLSFSSILFYIFLPCRHWQDIDSDTETQAPNPTLSQLEFSDRDIF